ncbi:lytic murein transglycosylase [Chelatococcus reniformis]|nr:lytic murein transglycosylase [Chelatococcus reniformis]
MRGIVAAVAVVAGSAALSGGAHAAQCGSGPAGFPAWEESFKREAAAAGISPAVINSAFANVSYDQGVINKDRGQHVFKQSFEQFSARMISGGRLAKGKALMRSQARTLQAIQSRFGVPGAVVIAIWGLETDYGVVRGNTPSFTALATLAYDCRRTAFFTKHLMDALRVVQRGDLTAREMRGAWAGEVGQAQFMPSAYYNYAVDFDGDGRADLIRSSTDTMASIANYLRGHGWRPGAGWNPGEPNFAAIKEWNKADVYARTIALFANKLQASVGQ